MAGKKVNPLLKIEQAEINNLIPANIIKKIKSRMHYLEESVRRVEHATKLKYPTHYIEPLLYIYSSRIELGQMGILYARTMPVDIGGSIEIVVQISSPLIAFGTKQTIDAVLTHEFLHYVELVKRFSKLEILSQELTSTMFEASYTDSEDLFPLEQLINNRPLKRLLKQRFSNGLIDEKLQEKVEKQWLSKGLPAVKISPDSNVVNLSISSIINSRFDPFLTMRLDEIEQKDN